MLYPALKPSSASCCKKELSVQRFCQRQEGLFCGQTEISASSKVGWRAREKRIASDGESAKRGLSEAPRASQLHKARANAVPDYPTLTDLEAHRRQTYGQVRRRSVLQRGLQYASVRKGSDQGSSTCSQMARRNKHTPDA